MTFYELAIAMGAELSVYGNDMFTMKRGEVYFSKTFVPSDAMILDLQSMATFPCEPDSPQTLPISFVEEISKGFITSAFDKLFREL